MNYFNYDPYRDDYEKYLVDYVSKLNIMDLDKWRVESIQSGNGFVVDVTIRSKPKDVVDENIDSVFSSKFGATLRDQNLFGNAYRCKCGMTTGKITNNEVCPICRTVVSYIGENLEYYGWIVLKNHKFIHPQIFVFLQSLIGKDTLDEIIKPLNDSMDADCKKDLSKSKSKNSNNPFIDIGLKEFMNRFDEILHYYCNKNKSKKDKVELFYDILSYRDIIFTSSYPVYTTQLRPCNIDNGRFEYNDMNEFFVSLSKTAALLNNDSIISHNERSEDELLYTFQNTVNDAYSRIRTDYLPDKYGSIRKVIGGRCNLTSRNVIIPNSTLKVDECIMSYYSAVKVLEQYIINVLFTFGYQSLNDARIKWERACAIKDPVVENIIRDLIKNHKSGRGFPVLMNRNPTIDYGGIMQMYIVDITDSYALEIPLLLCKIMAADFDGDKHNVLWCLMDDLIEAAEDLINPRNNMFISKNDGKFNRAMSQTTDIIVNLNSLHDMYFNYTHEELEHNNIIKKKYIS